MLALIYFATAAMNDDSALKSMVSFERAFAADVAKRGIKEGFLATMDSNSTVFIPQPANGQDVYGGMPPSDMQLLWEPWVSGISADGKLGFNVGPYRLEDPNNPTAAARTGMFTSVWRKSGDSWKMVFDCGAPGPAMPVQAYSVKTIEVLGKSTIAELLKANENVVGHLDAESMFFFTGEPVAIGQAAFLKCREKASSLNLVISDSGISESGDLGWVFGTAETSGKSGGFSRIWRYTSKGWRVCTEVVLPPR